MFSFVQVFALFCAFLPYPLSKPLRLLWYAIATNTAPPLFYIVAAEKDNIMKWRIMKIITRSQNDVKSINLNTSIPC